MLKVFFLVGPTGVGKTGIVTEIAKRIPGVQMLCGDSMQIYKALKIGMGTRDADEMMTHFPGQMHLYAHFDASRRLTPQEYQMALLEKLALAQRNGAPVLIEGGSRSLSPVIYEAVKSFPESDLRTGHLKLAPLESGDYNGRFLRQRMELRTDGFIRDGIIAEVETLLSEGPGRYFALEGGEPIVHSPVVDFLRSTRDETDLVTMRERIITNMMVMHYDQVRRLSELPVDTEFFHIPGRYPELIEQVALYAEQFYAHTLDEQRIPPEGRAGLTTGGNGVEGM